jgi:hypothetical protein
VWGAAYRALWKIAESDEGRAAVVATGTGVPAIVAALVTHAGEADVRMAACLALRNIACSDEGGAAVVPAIVAALVTHAGEARVCGVACNALRFIAESYEGRAAVVATGTGVPAIVAALVTHAGEAVVCKAACYALDNIAESAEGRAAIEAAGAVDVLLAMLAAEHPAADAARAALQRIRPPAPSMLMLLSLPPRDMEARLASCLECWIAKPRAACAHGGARDPCPICQDDASLPDASWTALPCGHLFHARCMCVYRRPLFAASDKAARARMPPADPLSSHPRYSRLPTPARRMNWAANQTHGARAAAALPAHTAAVCPMDRCVVTRAVPLEAAPEGAVPVDTPAATPLTAPAP